MKNYTITVNGNVYDVTVEEGTGSTAGAAKAATPKAAAPKAAPKAAAPAGAQGAVKVNAPMPGKILKVNVNAGTAVKKGGKGLFLSDGYDSSDCRLRCTCLQIKSRRFLLRLSLLPSSPRCKLLRYQLYCCCTLQCSYCRYRYCLLWSV